ncbi:MAG: sirohydrochlorin chelatase [Nitrospinae bacterium]|nr:sirohydrochlorin chelatase [Nitrospinota bacterium]
MQDFENSDYTVCLVGHGTRDQAGINEFWALSSKFKERNPNRIVECGFLEYAEPDIDKAISNCVRRGAKSIVVVPGLLTQARHAKKDIPEKVIEFSKKYPSLNFKCGGPLGFHPNIIKVCAKRIESAETHSKPGIKRNETLLLTVGRGSSDPEANSVADKTSQSLYEIMGFGGSETGFIGTSEPLFEDVLETSVGLGFKRIIIFPYFLFTGVLVKKIFSMTDNTQKKYPEIEFLKAQYLNHDELIIDVFMERVQEAQANI